MRADGDRLYYETPEWTPYDPDTVERAGVPRHAADALSGRGLPHNAYEIFIRDSARELAVADLSDCGPAAFLANYTDEDNSYWVSLTARYGCTGASPTNQPTTPSRSTPQSRACSASSPPGAT